MGLIGKLVALFIIIALVITVFSSFFWIILGLVVLFFLIRLLADLFWWGKDNGKW